MTGPDHFHEAELLLEDSCDYGCPHTGGDPVTIINVTAEHIRDGQRGVCAKCPAALAFAAAFPGAVDVWVGMRTAELRWPDQEPDGICLPPEAVAFIGAFDYLGAVEPFSFTVDYPAEVT